jgi:flagellar protein FlgJ
MNIEKIGSANYQANNQIEIAKSSEEGFENRLKKAFDEKDEKELKKACYEFDSIFTKIIYKQMKSTIMKSDFMPNSSARDMFESMLDDKLSEESSKSGGIGIGEMLFKQMKKDMINKYK